MNTSKLTQSLLDLYVGEKERVGFIMSDGEIIEVQNICSEPTEGFEVSGEDIVKYATKAVATWHTHPGEDSNLSANDYLSFLNWSDLDHYIIGNDGVSRFLVEDGEVLIG